MMSEIWEPLPEYPDMGSLRVEIAHVDDQGRVTYRAWPAESVRPENVVNWRAETLRQYWRRRDGG